MKQTKPGNFVKELHYFSIAKNLTSLPSVQLKYLKQSLLMQR